MDDVSAERWLPVVGFEGQYEVSDKGRVRSVDRVVPHGRGIRPLKGKILAYSTGEFGHLRVSLYRDGKHTLRYVHFLVAEAFLGPRPEGMEVRHGPKGKFDNTPANLSYGTSLDNTWDKIRDGVLANGTRLPQAKLTEDAVRELRARYAAGGVSMQRLADESGVSLSTMWHALRSQTWKHVTQ